MAIPDSLEKTIAAMAERLQGLPTHWDGKGAILELKAADYQWRQMEWIGFYFEYKAKQALAELCTVPGDKINKVEFDLKKDINFALRSTALQTDWWWATLDDVEATQKSVNSHGWYGAIIAFIDVKYEKDDGQFQNWHIELKGGLSQREKKLRTIISPSNYSPIQAKLGAIDFVIFDAEDLEKLGTLTGPLNAKERPGLSEYLLDLDEIDHFRHITIEL